MNAYLSAVVASLIAALFRLALLWLLALPYMANHADHATAGTAYTVLSGLELAVFGCVMVRLMRMRWPEPRGEP